MAEFTPQPVKGPDEQLDNSVPEFPDRPLAPDLQPDGFWPKFKNFYSENKWYMWAIVVGLAIIAVLAVIAFWPRHKEPTEQAKVSVSFDAPATVSAGGEVIYKIKILNQDPAKLVDMNLELVYDEGLTYVSSTPKPENLSGSSYLVPDLSSGQNAVVIVKTLVQGNVNDDKRLVARLHYSFDNFSSDFTTEQSHTVRLVASDVIVDLSGPDTAANGDELTYTINYRNSSKKDIENSRIQLTHPEKFELTGSNPEASLGKNVWNLGTLEPNQTGQIEFTGRFQNTGSGEEGEFTVEFLVLDNEGNFFTQSSNSFSTRIESKALSIEQRLTSGSSGGVVNPGQTVNVELSFQNTTQIANTGLQVTAEINSSSVDLSSIKAESGFVSGNTISWNASGVAALEQLDSGSSATLRYSFKVKNPATQTNQERIEIALNAKIKSNENSTYSESSVLKLKVASPVAIVVSVDHSGGAQPPVVGVASAYSITIDLSNQSNAMRDGIVTAYIPTGVNLDPATFSPAESNLTSFDKSTGKITWRFGQLIAHAGNSNPARSLSFVVTITPTSSQLGQNVELLKDIVITAKDDFTGASVEAKANGLNTGSVPSGVGRVQS